MDSHGLRVETRDTIAASEAGASLRADLGSRVIVEADDAAGALVGCEAPQLVGLDLDELWFEAERPSIAARFDDAVLLGHDVFGALALRPRGGEPVWVEVDARFAYRDGERLEIELHALQRPEPPDIDLSSAGEGDGGGTVVARPSDPAAAPAAPPDAADAEGPAPAHSRSWRPLEDDTAGLVMAALEATGAAVLFVGADGGVLLSTPAAERLVGVPPPGVRGRHLESVLDLPGKAAEALSAARSAGSRQAVLTDAPGRGGQMLVEWVPGLVVPTGYAVLTPQASEPEGDSERLRLQAQLVSHVSHDLRGALNAAYFGLRTLVEALAEGRERDTARQSLAEVQRATRIVDEVLALSRPGRLRREDLELSEAVESTLARFDESAGAAGVRMVCELAPDARVSADRSSLERALGNLVENAIRAMADGGELTVSTVLEDRVGPGVRLSVADTGVGIAPDLQASVFEPFVSNADGGSGLGLTITRHIVLAHGGQIDLESAPGRGTAFHIWLPRLD